MCHPQSATFAARVDACPIRGQFWCFGLDREVLAAEDLAYVRELPVAKKSRRLPQPNFGPQLDIEESTRLSLAETSIWPHPIVMEVVDPIDPTVEIQGEDLRKIVCYLVDWGRTIIGYHQGQDRMAERNFTGGEILNTLTKGVLTTNSCVAGKWRYSARRYNAEIIFTFDVDDDGNMLVIVTLIRKGAQP